MLIVCYEEKQTGNQTYKRVSQSDFETMLNDPNINIVHAFRETADIVRRSENMEKAFNANYERYGFKSTDIGRQFVSTLGRTNGHKCTFVGLKLENRKYPCIIKDETTGDTYKVSPSYLHKYFD